MGAISGALQSTGREGRSGWRGSKADPGMGRERERSVVGGMGGKKRTAIGGWEEEREVGWGRMRKRV